MDIREADDEMLIEALADRGIDVRHIKTRRRLEVEKRYEQLMEQGVL